MSKPEEMEAIAISAGRLTFLSMSLTILFPGVTTAEKTFSVRGSWIDFRCDDREDGAYPDAVTNCAIYHICHSGRHLTRHCQAGEMYDIVTERCQPEMLAYCPQELQVRPVNVDTDPECISREGYFADVNSGCQTFFQCKNGQKSMLMCRPGLLFDEYKQACTLEETAVCGEAQRLERLQEEDRQKPISAQTRQIKFDPFYSSMMKRVGRLAFQLRGV